MFSFQLLPTFPFGIISSAILETVSMHVPPFATKHPKKVLFKSFRVLNSVKLNSTPSWCSYANCSKARKYLLSHRMLLGFALFSNSFAFPRWCWCWAYQYSSQRTRLHSHILALAGLVRMPAASAVELATSDDSPRIHFSRNVARCLKVRFIRRKKLIWTSQYQLQKLLFVFDSAWMHANKLCNDSFQIFRERFPSQNCCGYLKINPFCINQNLVLCISFKAPYQT